MCCLSTKYVLHHVQSRVAKSNKINSNRTWKRKYSPMMSWWAWSIPFCPWTIQRRMVSLIIRSSWGHRKSHKPINVRNNSNNNNITNVDLIVGNLFISVFSFYSKMSKIVSDSWWKDWKIFLLIVIRHAQVIFIFMVCLNGEGILSFLVIFFLLLNVYN